MSRAAAPAPAAPAQAAGPERPSGPQAAEPELVAPDDRRPVGQYRPRDLLSLQHLAGNAAVTNLVRRADPAIQRDTATPLTHRPPERLVKRAPTSAPLVIESLTDALTEIPKWLATLRGGQWSRARDSAGNVIPTATDSFSLDISHVTLFARDAIYYFTPDGQVLGVDTNLKPADPAKPDVVPDPVVELPAKSTVMALDSGTGQHGQVVRLLANDQLIIALEHDKVEALESATSGTWQILAYAPDRFASKDGGPQPGFISTTADVEPQPQPSPDQTDQPAPADQPNKPDKPAAPPQPPRHAEIQLDRVRTLLQQAADGAGESEDEGDVAGTGTGLKGEGPGGGGKDTAGTGTGRMGSGPGASTSQPGSGRGRSPVRPRDRVTPDKVVMYQGKHGTNVNVWKGGTAESIPYKAGESDASLLQRIEEAAARLMSTGKRLADGGADTGFLFGHGGGKPSEEEMAEATKSTANAQAYPSRMAMQGGSGAEISPKGWATTVAGADHDFDMVLDWDAVAFGQVNQTFARLGWVSYFWEVVDVSTMSFDPTSTEGARKAAREAKTENPDNARQVHKLSDWKGVSNSAKDAGEDLEDRPTFNATDPAGLWAAKAGEMAIQGISATWDIAKSIVSAFIEKMTEPENRQTIHLKDPGEFVIRCLANPIPNADKPEADRTIRATSVAAFPVRVLNIDTRAKEVSRSEQSEIDDLKKAVEAAKAGLAATPDDAGKQAALDLMTARLTSKQQAASKSTTQKLADDAKGLNDEYAALNALISQGGKTDSLTGDTLAAAMRIKNEEGLLAPWQWDMRREDVKKALDEKIKQVKRADSWKAEEIAAGAEEVRPRVTFVSEENGAVVRMAMILGQAPGSNDEHPKWTLLDVTSHATQNKYHGASDTPGYKGHSEAIEKAFAEFAEKAEYGRGTISTGLPSIAATHGPPSVPATMPMKPGEFGRWRKRLQNIVEIAGLVAPFMEGGVLAEVAAASGAADSAYKLYDRFEAGKLDANFETLTDVLGALGPVFKGMKSLSEVEGLVQTKTGYLLEIAAKGGELAGTYIVPLSIYHDLDQVIRDTQMDPAQKHAQVAMILGKAFRDKVIHILGEQARYSREGPWVADEPSRPAAGAHPHGEEEEHAGAGGTTAPKHEPEIGSVPPNREHEGAPQPEPEPEPEPDHGGAPGGGVPVAGGGPGGGGGGGGGSAAHEPGMPAGAVAGLKEMSAHYGITIDVRPPTIYARGRLAKGSVAKPMEIKAKTINRADVLMGAPEAALGLVGYFEPKQPTRPHDMGAADWTEVEKRFTDRLQEHGDLAEEMHARTQDGTIRITDGVVRLREPRGPEGGPARYRTVTGDLDLYQIHWADGHPMTTFEADVFAGELRHWGIAVEHGAHLRWTPRNAHEQEVYDKVVAGHGPGKAPLLRFEPGAEPQRVDNSTPITIQPGHPTTVNVAADPARERAWPKAVAKPPAADQPEPSPGPDDAEGQDAAPAPEAGAGPRPGAEAGPGPEGGSEAVIDPAKLDGGEPQAALPADRNAATKADEEAPIPADLQEPTAPSMPTGDHFEKQPKGRFVDTGEKPAQGVSKSTAKILVDTVTGKKYLFKPSKGDRAVDRAAARGILRGTYAHRAKAGELVAKGLGIETPEVKLVQIGSRKGSLTEWTEGTSLAEIAAESEAARKAAEAGSGIAAGADAANAPAKLDKFAALTNDPKFLEARAVIEAFDYLVNNVDRLNNKGNYLVRFNEDGTFKSLVPIDHDLTFTATRTRARIDQYATGLPKSFSPEMQTAIRKLWARRDIFAESIRPLVGDQAVEGFLHRLAILQADVELYGFNAIDRPPEDIRDSTRQPVNLTSGDGT